MNVDFNLCELDGSCLQKSHAFFENFWCDDVQFGCSILRIMHRFCLMFSRRQGNTHPVIERT